MKKSIPFSNIIVLSFPIAVILFSCNKDKSEILPVEPVVINLTANQSSLISSGNTFAFDLFRKVAAGANSSENLIISPFSISVALSMTLNGANGSTRDAITETLRSNGLSPEIVNNSYKDLSQALLNVDKRVLLTIANSVWTENKFPVKKQFSNILAEYYSADAKSFNIEDPAVPAEINNWIENKTNGLIKNMVGELSDQTVMLLINAIYFKGKWNSQFDKDKTVNEPFYKSGGGTAEVPMMKQKSDFKAYNGDGFVLAEFPYGQGNYVMDVILPDDHNGADNLIQTIKDVDFNNMLSGLHQTEIDLSLPRFKYGYKKQLNDILSDMGMGIAFTENADFSEISDLRILISKVLHQAFIETNEEGTEAAAATVVQFELTSMPAAPLVLKLDHPFLYIIRETTTNSILFMGKVADPLAS